MDFATDELDDEQRKQQEAANAFQGIMQLANARVSPPSVGPQPKQDSGFHLIPTLGKIGEAASKGPAIMDFLKFITTLVP